MSWSLWSSFFNFLRKTNYISSNFISLLFTTHVYAITCSCGYIIPSYFVMLSILNLFDINIGAAFGGNDNWTCLFEFILFRTVGSSIIWSIRMRNSFSFWSIRLVNACKHLISSMDSLLPESLMMFSSLTLIRAPWDITSWGVPKLELTFFYRFATAFYWPSIMKKSPFKSFSVIPTISFPSLSSSF